MVENYFLSEKEKFGTDLPKENNECYRQGIFLVVVRINIEYLNMHEITFSVFHNYGYQNMNIKESNFIFNSKNYHGGSFAGKKYRNAEYIPLICLNKILEKLNNGNIHLKSIHIKRSFETHFLPFMI